MTRWKITIEYKGTDYYGWQIQDDVPTIQSAVEEALLKFCQQKITVQSSGRTDAGVHARAQIAHFDLDYGDRPLEGFELVKALNAHLRPASISVLKAEEVEAEFHARHSSKNKFYQYRIINRPSFLALDKDLAWQIKRPLDAGAMHEAAQILIGHHDFSTFRDSECQAQSPKKTLDRLDVIMREYDDCGALEILIEAEAKSFLHHQVRNIVGTLSLVGEGKWTKDDLQAALDARDRTKGGPTAPAAGLYLMKVSYT